MHVNIYFFKIQFYYKLCSIILQHKKTEHRIFAATDKTF